MKETRTDKMVIFKPDVPSTAAIVAIHGAGERGSDLDFMLSNSQLIKDLRDMVDSRGYALYCPQLLSGASWSIGNYQTIDSAVASARGDGHEYIHLVGHSLGGQLLGYPQLPFLKGGVIVVSGVKSGGNLAALKSKGIWYIHDINDTVVLISQSESNHAATGGQFDRVTGYGHNLTPILKAQSKYMDWLLQKKVEPVPLPIPPPPPPASFTINGPGTVAASEITLEAVGAPGQVEWFIHTLSGGDYNIRYEGNSIYGSRKKFSDLGPGTYEAEAKSVGQVVKKQFTVTLPPPPPTTEWTAKVIETGETITLIKVDGKYVQK